MKGGPRATRPALAFAAWTAFAALLAYFAASAWMGLTRIEFGDETEKLVAALMLREGGRLYRDVFTQHGPLSYVLPHALVSALGADVGVRATRVGVVLVTLGAAAALAWSPVISRRAARAIAIATFLGALAPVWLLQALNLGLYHNLAGCLAVVVLGQLVVPAILGVPVSPGAALVSGVATGLVPFAAYSHGPAVALFALAALVGAIASPDSRLRARRVAIAFVVGIALAVALVLAWLALFGDVGGFFAYGFVFNQRVYSRFIEFVWTRPLASLAPSLAPELAGRAVAVLAALLALGVLSWRAVRRPGGGLRLLALAILALGVLMLNPRGGFGFAANALVVAGLALAALAVGILADSSAGAGTGRGPTLAAIAAAACLVLASEAVSRVAVSSPNWRPRAALAGDRAIFGVARGPREELVRAMADPGERVQALVYRPHFYLETGRLPAAAQYYFLPWQAEYERDPVPGYAPDLCRELREAAPPVVFFDDWLVWGRYRFADYAPCIANLIEERYVPIALDPQLRIRRDRLVERWRPSLGLVPATREVRDGLGAQLPGLVPVQLELARSPGVCVAAPAGDAHAAPLVLHGCDRPDTRWHAIEVAGAVALVGGEGAVCVDVRGASTAEGADAIAWPCHAGSNQLVTIARGTDGDSLRMRHSGLCLAPDASGAGIEQRACDAPGVSWRLRDPAATADRDRDGRSRVRPQRAPGYETPP